MIYFFDFLKNISFVYSCKCFLLLYVVVSGIFHKYDGFIYPKPGAISWDRFFPFGSAMDDRRRFFQKFFPKWSGFCLESFDEIQPVEALKNLDKLVEDVSFFCTSVSEYPRRREVKSCALKIWEVSATRNKQISRIKILLTKVCSKFTRTCAIT